MHNAAFRVLGVDAVYVALASDAEGVSGLMQGLARAGGGGNVTLPHKATAAHAVDRPSNRVSALGVCNTFWAEAGGLAGENTDVDGVLAALDRLDAPATSWLVLGTGGSARAVAEAARVRGARLASRSRDGSRAAAFLAWTAGLGISPADAEEAEVVINATPLGLDPSDALPSSPDAAPRSLVALDLVYARGETRWVRAQRTAGRHAADGREVLVSQGAASLARWLPGVHPPVEVMRAAVHAALR
jgi:shikimate dehydrogenase